MDNVDLDQFFINYPSVAKGVREMIQRWEDASLIVTLSESDFTLQFKYTRSRHAFRVETAARGRTPRLVIYTGANDAKRGSPLVKGANSEDKQKLSEDFGIPENTDRKPDWLKSLCDSTPAEFYTAFVKHALKMVGSS